MTLALAQDDRADQFVVGDSLPPLVALWRLCVGDPDSLADRYEALWQAQLDDPRAHYLQVRDDYNRDGDPVALLYLLARCVKNAPRFDRQGRFNQSADHRRRGRKPALVRSNARQIASLLRGRARFVAADFRAQLKDVTHDDLVYLDPPWLGTTEGSDKRYVSGLSRDRLIKALRRLNNVGAAWVLSYDGRLGSKRYGPPLPENLGALHLEIDAGRSSQSTLSGRAERTFESLYVGPGLQAEALQAVESLPALRRAH